MSLRQSAFLPLALVACLSMHAGVAGAAASALASAPASASAPAPPSAPASASASASASALAAKAKAVGRGKAASASASASTPAPAKPASAASSPASSASRPASHAHAARAKVGCTQGRHCKAAARTNSPVRDDGAPDAVLYGRRDDVVAFAAQAAESKGLDPAWVEAQLARARYQPSVARLVMPAPAGVAKNWAAYRARFIEPQRVQAGVQWWQAHAKELAQAEERFGVPPEIVAGIVGVETYYGRQMGHYRVLDALATLAFDFPKGRSDRSVFYRDELSAYLAWCAREHREADTTMGSYAGAIGWPQFMPSSIFRYAVDFDADGRIDLDAGGADVIGSVANYLATFGWKRGMATTYGATPPAETASRAALLAPDILPTFTAAQMQAQGAVLPEAAQQHDGPLALVELQNGDAAATYVAGTSNFYVVTRYNWSAYYAMAVIDLAESLKREMRLAPAARALR
jgi:membrane-bound lytic murein transglycosylase B